MNLQGISVRVDDGGTELTEQGNGLQVGFARRRRIPELEMEPPQTVERIGLPPAVFQDTESIESAPV